MVDFIAVLEALYRQTNDLQTWHTSVLDTAHTALTQHRYCDFIWMRESADGRRTLEMTDRRGVAAETRQALASTFSLLESCDERLYKRFFYPRRRVAQLKTILADMGEDAVPLPVQDFFSRSGLHDVVGLIIHPIPGVAGVFALNWNHADPCAGTLLHSFQRVRLHFESALRLHLSDRLSPEAILRPDGRVEHLAAQPEQAIDAAALSQRVGHIERIRNSRERERQPADLALWQALVDGRFSLVEVRDADGKRHYHAFENAPHVRRFLALTQLESQVVEHVAQGLTGKEITYALGIHASDASRAVASAVMKLGFHSRADLARAARALRQWPLRDAPDTLTRAEREILELVQLGHSNASIARLRARSTSTIANQVAEILRKTGTRSRRELMLFDANATAPEAAERGSEPA